MRMREVWGFPPNYAAIKQEFSPGPYVVYAWGNIIYNPGKVPLGPETYAHERVHGIRQGNDIEGWWSRYIDDYVFRFREEVPAHIAEYIALVEIGGGSRRARRQSVKTIAKKLSSPLYGSLCTADEAIAIIKQAEARMKAAS